MGDPTRTQGGFKEAARRAQSGSSLLVQRKPRLRSAARESTGSLGSSCSGARTGLRCQGGGRRAASARCGLFAQSLCGVTLGLR
eukprot:12944583-Alexandrium_andersonii.AAC.1